LGEEKGKEGRRILYSTPGGMEGKGPDEATGRRRGGIPATQKGEREGGRGFPFRISSQKRYVTGIRERRNTACIWQRKGGKKKKEKKEERRDLYCIRAHQKKSIEGAPHTRGERCALTHVINQRKKKKEGRERLLSQFLLLRKWDYHVDYQLRGDTSLFQ